MPKVSILMSVHNNILTLQETLDSIFLQSFEDWELIIVNDFSTDGSDKILNTAKSSYDCITIINNTQNIGLTRSLNKGLFQCSGQYIARIDADDLWGKDKLIKQVEFIDKNNDYGLVGTKSSVISGDGGFLEYRRLDLESNSQLKNAMPRFNPFEHSSVVFDRKLVQLLGGYNEGYEYSQDYHLWATLMIHCKFYKIPESLTFIRLSDNSISSLNHRHQKKNSIKIKYLIFLTNKNFFIFLIYMLKDILGLLLPFSVLKLYRKYSTQKEAKL